MMGVYIKGMEMPKNCSVCALNRALYCCAKSCGIRSYHENRTKPDWCPLIEVPPHGRLIDADDIESITVIQNDNGVGFKRIDAPTIIPADKEEEA